MSILSDQYKAVGPTHFPVVLQFCVLLLLLTGVFGGLLVMSEQNSSVAEDSASTLRQSEAYMAALQPASVSDALRPFAEPNITAASAVVLDATTGEMLYEKNADDVRPLASITKVMTALVAHELQETSVNTAVPVDAVRQSGNSGLLPGEQFALKDLLSLALAASSNDAAYAVAGSVGQLLGEGNSIAQFVRAMNVRAEELQLETISFLNPTGLDVSANEPGAVGSAHDVSQLMAYIVTNHPQILEDTTQSVGHVYNTQGQYHTVSNTNELVTTVPNILASKTGYTDLAGGNLTIAVDVGFARPVIITVLGSTREGRFADVELLLQHVTEAMVSS